MGDGNVKTVTRLPKMLLRRLPPNRPFVTPSKTMVGLFLGPIVLAVFYELVVAWVLVEPPVSDRDEL